MEQVKQKNADESQKKIGTRHIQALLMFSGMAIAYGIRVCMSVGVVAMTDRKSNYTHFDWDTKTNAIILSSFFWGYVIMQIPIGYFASTRGGQKILACGMMLSGLLNMMIPLTAFYDWRLVVVCRAFNGLCQGCLFPCVQALLSSWAPPAERARMGSFVFNGAQFGTVIALPISGYLAASRYHWPSVFYVFGAAGIFWGIFFYLMGANQPSEHPRICPKEVEYINGSLGKLDKQNQTEKAKVPWIAMMTSLPMLSLVVVHSGHNYCYYAMLTEIPTFMKSFLGFDIQNSALISALPYLAMWILGFPASWISDFAISKGASVGLMRKLMNTIAFWGPGLALLVLCWFQLSDKAAVVFILVIAVGLNTGTSCGFQINHIDLSPNFAGTMMSITNSIGNLFGLLAPLVCGYIVDSDKKNATEWYTVFYIAAGVYFLTNLVFIVFGKAEIQSWNNSYKTSNSADTSSRKKSIIYDPTILAVPEKFGE